MPFQIGLGVGGRLTVTLLAAAACACGGRRGNPDPAPDPVASTDASAGDSIVRPDDPPEEETALPGDECLDRCEVWTTDCGFDSGVCVGVCSQLSREELLCIEALPCTDDVSPCMMGAVCGDGACDSGESSTCPSDCEEPGPRCGNGVCEAGESLTNCFQDCDSTPAADIGDRCECDDPTFECLGTETGCGFSLSGSSLACFVNSDDSSNGFCTRSCDPDADDCPTGTECQSFRYYLLPDNPDEEVYRCI